MSPGARLDRAHHEWLGLAEAARPPAGAVPVILPTVVGDSRTWRELYRPLAELRPLLMVDVGNRGGAPFLGRPISLERQVEEVWEAATAAGVERPIWVGSSSGTALAYRAAARRPSAGLALLSPLFSLGMERRIALVDRAFEGTLEDPTLGAFYRLLRLLTFGVDYLERHRFAAAAGLCRLGELYSVEQLRIAWAQTFFPEPDDPEILAAVECPLLVLRGREEMLQPLALLERCLAGLDLRVFRTLSCGHAVLEEAPETVCHSLDAFTNALASEESKRRREPKGPCGTELAAVPEGAHAEP